MKTCRLIFFCSLPLLLGVLLIFRSAYAEAQDVVAEVVPEESRSLVEAGEGVEPVGEGAEVDSSVVSETDQEASEAEHETVESEVEEMGAPEPEFVIEDETGAEAEEAGIDLAGAESPDQSVAGSESDSLSIDFADADVRTILRSVADIFHLNLVIPESLTGRISVKLHDVTWQQVFDVVLSPIGFTYVEDRNIIKVVSLESLTMEPPVTTVVILDYAHAGEIAVTLQPLVNPQHGGRVQVDKRSNALVITERPTQLRRIEEIIEALDRPNPQVMIESKFVETRNRALENIGVNWASLDGYAVSAGPFGHEYERSRRHGREGRSDRNQSMSQSQSSESVSPGGTTATTGTSVSQENLAQTLGFNSRETSKITSAVFSADEFGVILSALRTSTDVKLVSNPTVVTMNNQPARIHIGEEFPIVLPRFNAQTGTYEAGEYSTVDIGIKLDVTPQVNNAGYINLEVEPDVSTLTDRIVYFGAEYPVRSTRNAKSLVTVKDGYTLAIGGLVQEDTGMLETKVPVLGSIPVLGRLFRSDNNDLDQRNLIIFLTARTLSPDGMTIEDQVDPRMIQRMRLRRDEIPGYRPDIPVWPDEVEVKPGAGTIERVESGVDWEEADVAPVDESGGLSEEPEESAETNIDFSEVGDESEEAKEIERRANRRRRGWLTP